MVMIRKKDKAEKVAAAVLRRKGVKLQSKPKAKEKINLQGAYLLH
jgi:hypothetical protein